MIYCLGFTGIAISEIVAHVIFQSACDCIRDKTNERRVVNDDVEGAVTTDFDYGNLGAVCGVIFRADIDTSRGSTRVNFIVRDSHDLEDVRKSENLKFVCGGKRANVSRN